MWSICSIRKTTANQHQHETCTHTHTHLTIRHSASNVKLQCFRHPSTPTDGRCSTQTQPLPLTNAYSAMETDDVNRNNCNLLVFLLRLAWMYVLSMLGSNNNVRKYVYPMWTPTDRIVQSQSKDIQINTETMINDKSGKKRIKSKFPENHLHVWKQIHSLIIYWLACMPLLSIKTVQKSGWSQQSWHSM